MTSAILLLSATAAGGAYTLWRLNGRLDASFQDQVIRDADNLLASEFPDRDRDRDRAQAMRALLEGEAMPAGFETVLALELEFTRDVRSTQAERCLSILLDHPGARVTEHLCSRRTIRWEDLPAAVRKEFYRTGETIVTYRHLPRDAATKEPVR